MKVLLWGCTYSMWTVHFIEHFLLKNNYEVFLLRKSNKKEYIDLFESKGVHLIECPQIVTDWYDGRIKGHILKILYVHFLQIKTAVKSGHYDLINLHCVEPYTIIDTFILKCIMRTKWILSYWGSDLLRLKERTLRMMGLLAKHADYVTFENHDLRNKFFKIYKWADKIESTTALFGLSLFDNIIKEQKKKSDAEIRQEWGIPEGKSIVAVGYNGIPQQQHIAVLKNIAMLDAEWKNKIFLLLQMSYKGNDQYIKDVKEELKKTECEYLVIDRFLTDDEVADIRIITNIFIHAQTTDAFSGSVGENLFTGTVLINAKWLRYQEFKDYKFKYLEFENINEISALVKKALERRIDITGNKELIWKMRSWDLCVSRWERIYRKVLG